MAEYKISANLTANVSKFKRAIESAKRSAESLKREVEGNDPEIDADISPLRRAVLNAKRLIASIKNDKAEAKIDIDDGAVNSRISYIKAMLRSIPNKIRTRIDIDASGAQRSMSTLTRLLLALAPAAIPVIASIVPVIMAIGNALAVVGGGVIGLAGAFGIAGTGVMAFGAMAMRAYQMLQDGTIQATAQTVAFQTALSSLKTQFDDLVKSNAGAIFTTMTNGINIAKSALTGLSPFITGVANSMAQLSAKVSTWVQSSTVAQNFFNMMKTTGVAVFENIMTAAGRFGSGLISLFTQFGPLFSWVAQGLANMGAQFDAWSQKVGTAQGIQQFISYVQTNLPLIGQIFGNTFTGIFNLFKAFSSNSQTIFQSLAEMSARFAEWSNTVGQSQGFKDFINYVQTQGPVVMSTIGDIVNAVIQFATAMAPVGAVVLSFVSAVAQWIAGFSQAHPLITQIVGSILLFGGAIMKVIAFFKPFISVIMQVGGFIIQLVSKLNLVRNVLTLVSAAFALLTSPIGIAIAAVVAIGAAIYLLWTKCEAFRNGVILLGTALMTVGQIIMTALGNALRSVITWIAQVIAGIISFGARLISAMQNAWNMVTSLVTSALQALVSHISSSFSNMLSIASSIMSSIFSAISSAWSSIVSTISSFLSQAVSFVVSGFSQMISAVVSFASELVSNIVSAMSNFVSEIVSGGSQAVSSLSSALSDMVAAASGFVGEMVSAGADLIRGMIDGIKNMAGELVGAAKGVVGDAIASAKSLLKINSPSRVFRDIGMYTMMGMTVGINKEGRSTIGATAEMARKVTSAFNPQLATPQFNGIEGALNSAQSQLNTQLQSNVNVDANPQSIIVSVEGNAEWLRAHVNEQNAIDESLAF